MSQFFGHPARHLGAVKQQAAALPSKVVPAVQQQITDTAAAAFVAAADAAATKAQAGTDAHNASVDAANKAEDLKASIAIGAIGAILTILKFL